MIINIKMQWLLPLIILLALLIIFNVKFLIKTTEIGTIDVQKLVTIEAQKLASNYPKGDVPVETLRVIIENIQSKFQDFTSKRKIILLAKTAVLSNNVPDYTEEFIKVENEEKLE